MFARTKSVENRWPASPLSPGLYLGRTFRPPLCSSAVEVEVARLGELTIELIFVKRYER
jgi:hypothetical protein